MMAGPNREAGEKQTRAQRSIWPIGLTIGVIAGFALGFARGDAAGSAGIAVALGISFAFLSPLVRDLLTKKKSGDAVHPDHNASIKDSSE